MEQTPISPWSALLAVTNGIASQGVIIALLLIMGGMISVIIESGAVSSVINYSVYKLQHKSIMVLVPSIVVLMSVIGGLAGQDSLVALVAVGVLLAKKPRLDRIAAMSIFYLSYLTGRPPDYPMKLIQRRAYGFRNFENYCLRVRVLCG